VELDLRRLETGGERALAGPTWHTTAGKYSTANQQITVIDLDLTLELLFCLVVVVVVMVVRGARPSSIVQQLVASCGLVKKHTMDGPRPDLDPTSPLLASAVLASVRLAGVDNTPPSSPLPPGSVALFSSSHGDAA